MRDQYDAQIWNDHHDQFSEWLDGVFAAAGEAIRRAASATPPVVPQLLAAGVALSLTLLTVTASVA